MANEYNYDNPPLTDNRYTTSPFVPGSFEVGENFGSQDGAIRIPSVPVGQATTVISATLIINVPVKGDGSGNLKVSAYGIDEDNTADFSSNPLGRSKTSAVTNAEISLPPEGENIGINVTNQVNEILARGGWSNGNAMGFIIQNNGSPTDVYIFNIFSPAYLEILLTSRPDFYPSPTVVIAPSNPVKRHNFGAKVAKNGFDARTATDNQLSFSTSFPLLKALLYGPETVPENTLKEILHDLGYKGAFLVFAQEDLGGGNYGPAYKLPFILYSVTKDANLVSAYIDDDKLNVMASGFVQGATSPPLRIYYYIFIDDMEV